MLLAGAVLALTAAGISARRLARPLAALAVAADQVARGERVIVNTRSGPSEVRSLANAFQSMSQRLAELEGQRELILAGVSHDLRSPLARMRVATDLLDERDSVLAREMTRDIEEMDRMIGQFLRYARSNYHEIPALAIPDAIVRAALECHRDDARLVLELNADVACRFPAHSLHHMVVNLVQNAFDYGSFPVVVRTIIRESSLELSVHDSGAGLSADDWQRAIRPFERLTNASDSGHTGLGLAMVDRLVAACRGHWNGVRTSIGFRVEVSVPVNRRTPLTAPEIAARTS
jgi:two-component system osmolarity sensor histidine kinase EnvZ